MLVTALEWRAIQNYDRKASRHVNPKNGTISSIL
jgi:hypothetical protein